jgi:DmsE family decaheme c-type cytochrome
MKKGSFILLFMLAGFSLILVTWNMAIGDSGFVGSEACKDCHEAYYNKFTKSVHGKKAIPGTPINRDGCESCHGPGAQHVEKGGGKGVAIFAFSRKESAGSRSEKCFACHGDMKGMENWNMSMHKTADIACDMCHSPHAAKVEKDLLKEREPSLCFNCHKNIRAKFNKQSHHPIQEQFVARQALKCSSCHNPMGKANIKAMIRADSVNDLCYKCHAEKRGPYAFEHPPVPENCLFCHEIHGSNHAKLLVRKVPFLCQSCHNVEGHPSQPYTNLHSFGGPATSGRNRFFGRGCLNCHGNIHGSSLSEFFVR